MAINHAHSRVQLSRQWDVVSTAIINAEGLALVIATDPTGVGRVQPSTGSGAEVFAGISLNYTMLPLSIPYFNAAIVAVATVLTLPYTPVSGQIGIYDVTGAAQLTLGSAGTSGQFSVSGNVVTLNAAQSGHTMSVTLNYAPTVDQAISQYGEGFPGAQAIQQIQGRIGAVTRGTVATSCYDASSAWTVGTVKLGANGNFTQSGSGTTLSTVVVTGLPSTEFGGFLVLELLA